jgi:undecaprenyl diphosphate synthase
MDGNGRWAEGKGLSRLEGHREGHKSVRVIVRMASDIGLKALTLYVFSSENWKRPAEEVEGLMFMIEQIAKAEIEELHEKNVRVTAIGRTWELPSTLQEELERDRELTADNHGLNLNLAINYGGRLEIVDAVRRIAQLSERGELKPEDITEDSFRSFLYRPDLPDPDLLIRTGGEMRVSNFLLWESAYSEFYVTPILWPDFREKEFLQALEEYARRERRFGRVKGVVAG